MKTCVLPVRWRYRSKCPVERRRVPPSFKPTPPRRIRDITTRATASRVPVPASFPSRYEIVLCSARKVYRSLVARNSPRCSRPLTIATEDPARDQRPRRSRHGCSNHRTEVSAIRAAITRLLISKDITLPTVRTPRPGWGTATRTRRADVLKARFLHRLESYLVSV